MSHIPKRETKKYYYLVRYKDGIEENYWSISSPRDSRDSGFRQGASPKRFSIWREAYKLYLGYKYMIGQEYEYDIKWFEETITISQSEPQIMEKSKEEEMKYIKEVSQISENDVNKMVEIFNKSFGEIK